MKWDIKKLLVNFRTTKILQITMELENINDEIFREKISKYLQIKYTFINNPRIKKNHKENEKIF